LVPESPAASPTEIERVCVAVRAAGVVESVTRTVKLELSRMLGVPVMAPLDERLRPAGN
jgi:hypothetical protein